MNQRLNISDLSALLAEYTGKDKKITERFLRELVEIISDSLLIDRVVKVKGLGTFKSIKVEERESVHINTGERIVIPAHTKFAFVPDKELKELVNKPFASFETTELNEGVIFPETKFQMSRDDDSEEEIDEESEEGSVSPIMGNESSAMLSDQTAEEGSEPETLSTVLSEPDAEEKQTSEISASSVSLTENRVAPTRRGSQKRNGIWIVVGLLVFVGVFSGIYVWYNDFVKIKGVEVEVASSEQKEVIASDSIRSVLDTETLPPDSVTKSASAEESVSAVANQGQKDLIKITIVPDMRLTLIALKYYGNKVFWVYIYEHNKAVIKNPNNIQIGTELIIPDASVYGIDANDPESIAKAKAKQQEFNSMF
ncbi:MAG: HU family DNA-binding protein [Massilibacteroides sp.]|nr:HU family DNA-binding protein [Massilibacteroides sp.]MDD3061694.1 HU family DNA-binding protein [Massilibacteroides sp.]MDD4114388.1 HU family DNA-binding protein [Massilibacteroides sp.]MDD4660261.1 HU family DNA-binding protein [Massilibacteroides sp.]